MRTPRTETKKEARARIEKLREEIMYHRYLYHVLDRQEISEGALDSLKRELARLEERFPDLVTPDSPTQRVGGAPLSRFKKVRHATRMTSLNDAFSEEELREWEKRIKKLPPTPNSQLPTQLDYFAEAKIDGFAVSLVYKNGLLVVGSTRGDGITGEDVTENLKTIESVPLRLTNPFTIKANRTLGALLKKFPRAAQAAQRIPQTLEVRGEVYMTKKTFEAVNREQEKQGLPAFANPRNIAAGSVRQLDPKITAGRKLEFLAYDLITDLGQETHEEKHAIAQLFGFRTVGLARRCATIAEVVKFWKAALGQRERLPLLIDGIVAQVNSNALFRRLGIVGKAPRGAIAFKFPAEQATTAIEDIIVQIGRTGVLTPVAILKPIEIGGVTVSRATLHNMDEIERLDARIGDTVIVERAGDVIPDIVKTLTKLRPAAAKKFRMPKIFCGQPVVRPEGEANHRIPHPEKCDLVRRELLYHFVSKNAFDVAGLGPKIIDRLLDEDLIQDAADIFLLTEGNIRPLERFAEKSAENLVKAIQSKKTIELSRFIYALGIVHVGEETAFDLARHFGTLDKLRAATAEELEAVANIGPVASRSIHEWFARPEHRALLKKLEKAGVRVRPAALGARSSALSGKVFVLTGGLESLTRDEAKSAIRELGGEISESVGKKTDYVVAGSDPGSKAERGRRLGITMIDEKEFLKMLKV